MGVYEARGQLGKAIKQLKLHWSEAKVGWDDAISHALENDFLAPLEMDLRNAIAAMDQTAALIAQAKQDCRE